MKFHICLDIRGMLKKSDSQLKGIFKHDDDTPMTADECRNVLYGKLKQGYEVIPYGNCDNFDKEKGCQGHDK